MQLRMLLVSKRWKACAEYSFASAVKLDFSTSFGEIGRILKPCLFRTKVNTISFASCFSLDNNSLQWISLSPSAPLVKDLDFTNCTKITESGLSKLSPNIIQNLQRLVLSKSGVKSLSTFTFPTLEYLGLAQVSNLLANFFQHQQQKIRTVDLTKSNISNKSFQNLLTHCPNLENLYLSETPSNVLEELLKIDQYKLNLKILDISWLDGVNDNFLKQFIPKCRQLERLDLGNCNYITDESIVTVSVHCPNLIGLDISQCFRITSQSLIQVIDHCPQLRFLNVQNCDYITLDDLRNFKYKRPNLYIKAKRDLLKFL